MITRGVNLVEPILIRRWPARRDGTEVRVQLTPFNGRALIDVRNWYPTGGGTFLPGKGIACAVANLPALASALVEALTKARELGLIDQEIGR